MLTEDIYKIQPTIQSLPIFNCCVYIFAKHFSLAFGRSIFQYSKNLFVRRIKWVLNNIAKNNKTSYFWKPKHKKLYLFSVLVFVKQTHSDT